MKFTIQSSRLLAAVAKVSMACASRTTQPILTMVKLTIHDGKLSATATDLEIAFGISNVAVDDACEDGDCLVNPKQLIQILRESGDGEVTLSSEGDTITITSGFSLFEVPSAEPAGFPDMIDAGGTVEWVSVDTDTLVKAIESVEFAVNDNESKFATNGVFFDATRLVATDTKVLSVAEMPNVVGRLPNAIVPQKTVKILKGIEGANSVMIAEKNGGLIFQCGDSLIYTRLVQGRFPPYNDIIPKKCKFTEEIDAGRFLAGLRQVKTMIDEAVRAHVAFKDGQLVISTRNPKGRAEVKVERTENEGEFSFDVDPRYMIEALSKWEGSCEIRGVDSAKPIVLAGANRTVLVMPLS